MINRKDIKLALVDYLKTQTYEYTRLPDVQALIRQKLSLANDPETNKIIYQCLNEIWVKGKKGVHADILARKKKYIVSNRGMANADYDDVRKYYESKKTWTKTKVEQPRLTKEERTSCSIIEMRDSGESDDSKNKFTFDGMTAIMQGDKCGFKSDDKIIVEPKFDTLIEALVKRDSISKFAFLASLGENKIEGSVQ